MKNFKGLSKEEKASVKGGLLCEPILKEGPFDVDRIDPIISAEHPWDSECIGDDLIV